ALARFASPQGLAVDARGQVIVADTGNRALRAIAATGVVSTLVGGSTSPVGAADGPAGRLAGPTSVAVAAAGTVVFVDAGVLRTFDPATHTLATPVLAA